MKGQRIDPQITCAGNISCIHYTFEDGLFMYKLNSHLFNREKISALTNCLNAYSSEERLSVKEGNLICFASDLTHKAGINNHKYISTHGFEILQASIFTKHEYEPNEVDLGKYEKISYILR